ncbi:hypothetical protein Hanom_Chr11g01010331 [Helianthus anomalus]
MSPAEAEGFLELKLGGFEVVVVREKERMNANFRGSDSGFTMAQSLLPRISHVVFILGNFNHINNSLTGVKWHSQLNLDDK